MSRMSPYIVLFPLALLPTPEILAADYENGLACAASGSGVLPSLLAELSRTETRGIGMSLLYSISVTIFGGFAPLIATWLIAKTGDPLSPSFYTDIHRGGEHARA